MGEWVKDMRPKQPVISCWAEHNNTFSDILDVHLYNSDFRTWNEQVFFECNSAQAGSSAKCRRGAVVTEAGARWYQGAAVDAGSPLTVINYLEALRREGASFVPGVFLAWEMMVGNSNTRWMDGP